MRAAVEPLTYSSLAAASPALLAPALRGSAFALAFGGLAGLSCVALLRDPRDWAATHCIILTMAALATLRASRALRAACWPFPTLIRRDWFALDALAALAMFMIGLLPWVATFNHTDIWHWAPGQAALGATILMLAATSLRHRQRYRALATIFGPCGYPRTAYTLNAAGDVRTFFETAWFGVVALALIGPAVHWLGRADADLLAMSSMIAAGACAWICAVVWAAATLVVARVAYVAGAAAA